MKYDKINRKGYVYFRHRIYDPVTRKTKDVTAKTLKELKSKVAKVEERNKFGIINDNVLFGEFFNNWLDTVHLIDKKAATVERYKSSVRNHFKGYRIELIKLRDLKADDVQSHYNAVFEKKKASKTVETLHRIVKPCIRYAFETQRILKDFSGMLKIPVDNSTLLDKKRSVSPLTLDEQFKFIDAVKDHNLNALFNTALDTGMRMGELFALNWNDINFIKKEIRINKTLSFIKNQDTNTWGPDISTPKTSYSKRTIPLPKRTEAILLQHKISQKETMLKLGLKADDHTLIFCNNAGKGFERGNVLKRLKKVYKDLGMESKTFHDLRHTYATRLFEMGEDPKTVQVLLGHANVSTTLSTYIHILDTLKTQAASKIDGLYDQKKAQKKPVMSPTGKKLGKLYLIKDKKVS